ncbi:MAG: hypothetical protein K5924_07705 [Chloroflexi bacterium]|nr:hypothetical protein [Chloroflexota bacterium]
MAEAMCVDLRNGMTVFELHIKAIEFYRVEGTGDDAELRAARLEDLATREYCPEFREAFEATFTYRQWIAP